MKTPNEANDRAVRSRTLSTEPVVAPVEVEQAIDDALGLQLISIRLPKKLIEDLKLIANKEGLGYQPLVRRVLMRFAEAEFRCMAHEHLTTLSSDLQHASLEDDDTPLRRVASC